MVGRAAQEDVKESIIVVIAPGHSTTIDPRQAKVCIGENTKRSIGVYAGIAPDLRDRFVPNKKRIRTKTGQEDVEKSVIVIVPPGCRAELNPGKYGREIETGAGVAINGRPALRSISIGLQNDSIKENIEP